MIVVDTSALLEIIFDQPLRQQCETKLATEVDVYISAGSLTETLIVAGMRERAAEIRALVLGFNLRVVPVTEITAQQAADAYQMWGKGVHPAGLNLGDCFAYTLARELECPLLFVGNDFSRTDITAAL